MLFLLVDRSIIHKQWQQKPNGTYILLYGSI